MAATITPFRFLDLPPETRISICQFSTATLTVHIRPRQFNTTGELTEGATISTLSDCNLLAVSKQIRREALPFVQLSPTIHICRSAVAECHGAPHLAEVLSWTTEPTLTEEPEEPSPEPAPPPTPACICLLHYSPMSQLLITNRLAVADYFRTGFVAIRPYDCRFILKRWIRTIESHQQQQQQQQPGAIPPNPDLKDTTTIKTPPPWWPENITHRPSSDLTRVDRVILLTHILINAGADIIAFPLSKSHPCTALNLEATTTRHAADLQNPNSPEIFEEMFKVRRLIERMNMGEHIETILND